MASILRSSKFVRYFAALARNIIINQPREVDGTLVHRSQILANYIHKNSVTIAATVPSTRSIDRSIKRLDEDVRRTGRISRRELQEVIDEIRHKKHATTTQSLMVIRCCGNLVPEETPEVRTKLVKEVWQTFENLGIMMDISHYNALLRVYLENEYQFSPSEFLADLETKGVEPNRVTFQRLIAAYCQQGDIDGATRILEFMREKQMPVNENVFNALVMGHSQADDMESAKGILGVMKQAGIEPSAETYIALLCGYAKKGDMNSIQSVFDECKQAGIELMDRDLLDIVYTLAITGHSQYLDDILTKTTKVPGYNQDAKNTVLRLVARGEDKAAIKILRSMTHASNPDGQHVPSGNFLVKQMVRSNRPIESILAICEELKDENERALSVATEASLVCGNPDLSLKLLSALSKKEQVCQHYYWPVIVQYGKAQNHQGILQTLRQMSVDIGQPVSGETLRDYVVQYLSSGEAGIHELRQAGISLASAAAAVVGHLLMKKDIQGAARLALQYRANYNSLATRRGLVSAYLANSDVNSLVTLVQILEEGNGTTAALDEEEDSDEVAGKILLGIVSSLRKDRTMHTTQILQKCLDHGIGISNSTAELLQNKLSGEELTQEISTLLSKLTSPELIPTTLNRPASNKMLQVKDEEFLLRSISSVESKGESSASLKRQLLTLYCHNRELEKAVRLKQTMEAEGFEFQVGLLSLMLDLYTAHDMLPEALEYYDQIKKMDQNIQIDENKMIRLANLLVKNDRTEEAIELFKNCKVGDEDVDSRGFQHTSLCWKLFNALAEKGDVENLNKLFDIMRQNNIISPSNVLLGPLIKVHLLKNDIKGALDKFEECCLKYRATPWKNEIACKLIEEEDAASLQKLTDLSTQIHGEVNSLYDLVLSFVECGRIRQARKILETPGLRLRAQRINSACMRYKNEGLVNHLESLVEATKDISHINRADIYYHLLTSYSKNDEVDKGLGLWTQMQDEDVQPTDEFLVTLAELLKKHNRPVPFAVPDIPVPEVATDEVTPDINEINKRLTPVQTHLKTLRRAIFNKDLDQALSIKEKLKDSDLLMSDKSSLLNALVNSGRMGEATKLLLGWLENNMRPNIKAMNNAVNSLAKAGDVDSMNAIGKLINEDIKRLISFSNRYTHCMVEAGRTKDLLTSLEAKIDSAATEEEIKSASLNFPRGGIFSLFANAPEFIPHFANIADKFRAKGLLEPTNVLWAHYMMAGDKEKAEKLWCHLKNSERLLFQPIIKLARRNKDLTLAKDLLDICKQANISHSALGIIYGCITDIHLLQNQFSECEAALDEAIKICTIENIGYGVLNRMKRTFENNHLPFKYTIPPKKVKADTSSSSSDSETETTKETSRVH